MKEAKNSDELTRMKLVLKVETLKTSFHFFRQDADFKEGFAHPCCVVVGRAKGTGGARVLAKSVQEVFFAARTML